MSPGLTTLFGALGTVATLLAVLLPVMVTQGRILRWEIDQVRGDVDRVRGDVASLDARLTAEVAEVRRDLHGLSDRVARIEGALAGPWRPANGAPPPATGVESSR